MKRKIISIVLALTVLFAVSACGSEQENVGVKELQECTVQILLPGAEKPADFRNVLNAINDKLEEDGFVVTVHGKGTYVAPANRALAMEARRRAVEEDFTRALEKARAVGMQPGEIRELLELLLEEST